MHALLRSLNKLERHYLDARLRLECNGGTQRIVTAQRARDLNASLYGERVCSARVTARKNRGRLLPCNVLQLAGIFISARLAAPRNTRAAA